MSAARESGVSAMTMWALLGQAVGLKGEGGSRIIWTIMCRVRIFSNTINQARTVFCLNISIAT